MVVRCVSIDDWNRFVANHRAEKHTASRVDRTPGKRKAVKTTRAQRRQSSLSLPPHVAPIVVEKTADTPTAGRHRTATLVRDATSDQTRWSGVRHRPSAR